MSPVQFKYTQTHTNRYFYGHPGQIEFRNVRSFDISDCLLFFGAIRIQSMKLHTQAVTKSKITFLLNVKWK